MRQRRAGQRLTYAQHVGTIVSCLLAVLEVGKLAAMKFSQRLAGAYDAYEACVILGDVDKRVQQAISWEGKQPSPWPEPFYARLPNGQWYLEISWEHRRAAETASSEAVEHYREHFWAAARLPVLREQLLASGLPYPGDLKSALSRVSQTYEPKWKQLVYGSKRSTQQYLSVLPASNGDTPVVLLNVPSPLAAIEAYRAEAQRIVAEIKPLDQRLGKLRDASPRAN